MLLTVRKEIIYDPQGAVRVGDEQFGNTAGVCHAARSDERVEAITLSGTDEDETSRQASSEITLEIDSLDFTLNVEEGPVKLVNGVSFSLRRGETVGIVGESGSGKTMLVRALMGIAPKSGEVTGRVLLDGVDLMTLPKKERRTKLGAGIGMVFQNPMTSLNPVVPIGRQITEGLRYHRKVGKAEARERAVELLTQVGMSDPEKRLKQYPFQLSGGMRQRVVIASALACDPAILIADEATTALDVTVQKQILDLIKTIQLARNMAVVIISHDLGVVAGRTDQIVVMYAGQVVESGPTAEVFARHRHQYTTALLGAIPGLDAEIHSLMVTIPGSPRRPTPNPVGCAFAARCSAATDLCRTDDPAPTFDPAGSGHWYRCHHPRELPDTTAVKAPADAGVGS
jgi:peptide/nickel transport system ATP-binding protein